MNSSWTVMSIAIAYMAVIGIISFYAKRYSNSAHSFTSGGTSYATILIGFLLMSEFIGTTASVGTAQYGFRFGLSAAWNLIALGIGFVLYAFLFAKKFKDLGENTISAVLSRTYGAGTGLATSVIMILALQIVAVSVYASGGAVLSGLLHVDRSVAIVITGVVAVVYVSVGGMRSVIYTNVLHALVKYLGIIVATVYAFGLAGGWSELKTQLPARMFTVDAVGWPQIFAWILAGVGAVFSTQYVLQAISTVSDGRKAREASFYTAVLLVPFGVLAAICGMCALVIAPKIDSLQAFPLIISRIDNFAASIVVAGLAGSLFGTISAISIGTATLLYKDFYLRFVKNDEAGDKSLRFVRMATIFVGLLPIPLAIFAPDVLKVTFLAKSLRVTLAVLVLFIFYAPRFGSPTGAMVSILISVFATIGWFLAGDPYGIDNAYIALAVPLIVMSVSHLLGGDSRDVPALTLEEASKGERVVPSKWSAQDLAS